MSSILFDEHEIPVGRQDVTLTEAELDEMCDALDARDEERAAAVVERAYARLYARRGAEMLKRQVRA